MTTTTDDVSQDYVNALLGYPPEHWNKAIRYAQKLSKMVRDSGEFPDGEQLEDIYLLAAVATYAAAEMSMAGIVTRVRQIVKWCSRKPSEILDAAEKFGPTSLPVLENKGQELARMIAKHLYRHEGFLLLVFQTGVPGNSGYTTHVSSAGRPTMIRLLEEHLAQLKAMMKASD